MSKKRDAPGANGEWSGGWTATKVPRSARNWLHGWFREDSCPPDPAKRRKGLPTEQGGYHSGTRWNERHLAREKLVRVLRRSGYVVRHRWPRFEPGANTRRHPWRYEDLLPDGERSPVAGEPGADPWALARQLDRCSAAWHHQLRRPASGGLRVLDAPYRCDQHHACPVCAAARSVKLAAAIRMVVGAGLDQGDALVLVTLTQRDQAGESLASSMSRWRRAWALLRGSGRAFKAWKERVAGTYLGYEVTRGAEGREGALGRWWHVHGHLLVSFRPGVDSEEARRWLALKWEKATRKAAEEAGLPGYGWNPLAGVKREGEPMSRAAARVKLGDYAGPWWVDIDRSNPRQVFQAAKYPTPAVSLHPVALAEWVAVAFARRWHEGLGTLRGVVRMADEMEVGVDIARSNADDGPDLPSERPPDLGALVSTAGPGDSPTRGTERGTLVTWRTRWAEWTDIPVDVVVTVSQLGGDWYAVERHGTTRWHVQLTTDWMEQESNRTEDDLFTWREKRAADAANEV